MAKGKGPERTQLNARVLPTTAFIAKELAAARNVSVASLIDTLVMQEAAEHRDEILGRLATRAVQLNVDIAHVSQSIQELQEHSGNTPGEA